MEIPTFPVLRSPQSERYLVPMSVFVRAIAYLLDMVLIVFAAVIVMYAAGIDTTSFSQSVVSGTVSDRALQYFLWGSFAAQIFYFFIWEAAVGWTPGKRVFQMKVVRVDGRPCGVARAFVRNLILPIDLFVFGLIGALSISLGFKRQRLGDRLAATQVIREVPMALIPPPYVPADTQTRRCPRCGLLNPATGTQCQACGVNMDEAERAWQEAVPPFLMSPFGTRQATTPQTRRAPDDDAEDRDEYDDDDGYQTDAETEPEYYDETHDPAAYGDDPGREDEAWSEDEAGREDTEREDDTGRKAAERRAGRPDDEQVGAGATAKTVASSDGPGSTDPDAAEDTDPTDAAGDGERARRQDQPASRQRAAAGTAQRRTTARRPDRSHFLADEDEFERSAAAREILLDGSKEEVRMLAKILPRWHEEDREFVIAVARTLDGWRPTMVLEALRNDTDPEVQEAAKEALERVAERTAQKHQPYRSGD